MKIFIIGLTWRRGDDLQTLAVIREARTLGDALLGAIHDYCGPQPNITSEYLGHWSEDITDHVRQWVADNQPEVVR